MTVVSFRDLLVWQRSIELAEEIYKLTSSFPRAEMYGMTSQLRRAAVSISANLAEGNGRGSRRDYSRFVAIALGSAREVDSLLELTFRIGLLSRDSAARCLALLDETCRMLNGLRNSLLRQQSEAV
jgi:four helix bundle protein